MTKKNKEKEEKKGEIKEGRREESLKKLKRNGQ